MLLRVLHVPDDLAEIEGQILAGEGEAPLRAAEGERGGKGLRFRGGDGQTQGDGRAAVPVGRRFLASVLRGFGLRVGDDALRVAVAEGLRGARLEGALQLHHIEGVLRERQRRRQKKKNKREDALPTRLIFFGDNEKQQCTEQSS